MKRTDVKLTTPKILFENRHDAGRQLATTLSEYSDHSAVVLAIPNGGVPVALEVASTLKADLDVIVCRKIPIPLAPEGGFGAIADDGTMMLNETAIKRTGLSREQINYEAGKVRADIKQRTLNYKIDRLPTRLNNKTVIIIDDGMASGITMLTAVASVRNRHPKEIVVAVPVAPAQAIDQVEKTADVIVTCATVDVPKFHIADFYRYWHDLGDDYVVRYLNQWQVLQFRLKTEPLQDK
jgi:predicted phosphoribosyltransferase